MFRKYLKKCLISLVNRETQIKTTLRFHRTLVRWRRPVIQVTDYAGEDVDQGEHSFIADGSSTCTATLKKIWQFLRELRTHLPQDPSVPLVGTYPKDTRVYHEDTCSNIFTVALFKIARKWKTTKMSPSWRMDKQYVVHLHAGVLVSNWKKMTSWNLQTNGWN